MGFVKRVVGPDEKLIGVARIHWIYGLRGLVWLLGFLAVGIFIDRGLTDFATDLPGDVSGDPIFTIGNTILWICIVIGTLIFIFHFMTLIATEVGLTTKRVVYKTGLIFVDVTAVDIEEIKGANVDNGMFGRFLNYGYVLLDARFIENVNLPAIVAPYRFVKALNEMRSVEHSDSMKMVLEGVGDRLSIKNNGKNGKNGKKQKTYGLWDRRYRAFGPGTLRALREVAGEARESLGRHQPLSRHSQPHQEKSEPVIFRQSVLKKEIKEDFSTSRK